MSEHPHLPGDGSYNRIVFSSFSREKPGQLWKFKLLLTLPLEVREEIIYCGGEMKPGYWFDQELVNLHSSLNELAAECAFNLPNEARDTSGRLHEEDTEQESLELVLWSLRSRDELYLQSVQPETIYLVVQQGGSSLEWYPTFYDSVEEAEGAIKSHEEASYSAIGPFEFPNPKDSEKEIKALEAISNACTEAIRLDSPFL